MTYNTSAAVIDCREIAFKKKKKLCRQRQSYTEAVVGAEGVSRDSRDIKNFSHYLLWQVVLVNSCSGRGKMKFSCGQSCWRLSDKPGMRQRRPSPFLCWLPFPLCTATETNVLATFGISRDRNKLCGRRRLLSVRIVYYAVLIISSKH